MPAASVWLLIQADALVPIPGPCPALLKDDPGEGQYKANITLPGKIKQRDPSRMAPDFGWHATAGSGQPALNTFSWGDGYRVHSSGDRPGGVCRQLPSRSIRFGLIRPKGPLSGARIHARKKQGAPIAGCSLRRPRHRQPHGGARGRTRAVLELDSTVRSISRVNSRSGRL
jgi:hypothetical protein